MSKCRIDLSGQVGDAAPVQQSSWLASLCQHALCGLDSSLFAVSERCIVDAEPALRTSPRLRCPDLPAEAPGEHELPAVPEAIRPAAVRVPWHSGSQHGRLFGKGKTFVGQMPGKTQRLRGEELPGPKPLQLSGRKVRGGQPRGDCPLLPEEFSWKSQPAALPSSHIAEPGSLSTGQPQSLQSNGEEASAPAKPARAATFSTMTYSDLADVESSCSEVWGDVPASVETVPSFNLVKFSKHKGGLQPTTLPYSQTLQSFVPMSHAGSLSSEFSALALGGAISMDLTKASPYHEKLQSGG
eukprot:TRINITY_DN102506_c0_g1_i1.p1 TRINITY_DN102506_c0_g1~~TRINITY_DN102506_c0_g1_i1.p1  ORF type:complete len:298 (+),score=42.92 TRINITY_DN102506_c0_g1_i1:40-933(+)